MALVRTDYGLIYNTDGSLCATLLPEGGVAVTEGTTNLCNPAYRYTNTWTTIGYDWNISTIINCTAGDVFTISADIRNLSQGANRRWGGVGFYDSEGIELEFYHAMGSGMSEQRLSFTTPAAPTGTVEARVYWVSDGSGVSYQGKNFQIEKKPYDTPFVEGTRPPGALDIQTNLSLLQSGFIAFTFWTPKAMEHHDSLYNGALLDICHGDYRQLDLLMYSQGITLTVNDVVVKHIPYETHKKYFGVITWENGGNPKFYLDGELQYAGTEQFTDAGNGILQLGRYSGNYVNTVGFENLRFGSYTVSPETVATWYSLDAPFFDPRETATAELAARQYAEAQAELARVTAEAYADGRVTEEEQARIADAQQKLQEAKQYADQKAAEDIDASKRTIQVQGSGGKLTIDKHGEKWVRLSDGKVMYFFDVDSGDVEYAGRLVAGGGAFVTDEQGARSSNGSFRIGIDGNAYFGGTLKAAIVDTPQIVGGAISQRIVNNYHTYAYFEISGYYSEHREYVVIPYLSVNFTLDYASQVLINVSMATFSAVTQQDFRALYEISIWVDGALVPHTYRRIQPPEAINWDGVSFQIPVNISTALSLGAGSHSIQVTARALSIANSPSTYLGIATREINALIFKR